MSNEARFTYRPKPNGPLAPRVHRRQLMMAKVEAMIEDRDAVTDLSHEPDLTDFPEWACQFFGANLSTKDGDLVEEDDEGEDWLDLSEDFGLSDEEWAEMQEFNKAHGTDYYHDEDLSILRRHQSQLWLKETYRLDNDEDDVVEVGDVEIGDVEEACLDNHEDDVVEVQHQTWVVIDEVAVPSQSSVQYDDSVKALGWDAYKCTKKPESHGKHGRCKYRWDQKGRTDARTIRKIQKTFRAVDISKLHAES